MLKITSFFIDKLNSGSTIDNKHPSFSFVIEGDSKDKLDLITVSVNNWTKTLEPSERSVTYGGEELTPFTKYKVLISLNKGKNETFEFETGFLSSPWKGKFITDLEYKFTEKFISPKVMNFNKDLSLQTDDLIEAKIYMSTLGVYNLFLNNKRINKQFLAPGFTSYKHQIQYQTYNVLSELKENKDTRVDVSVAGGWAVGSFVFTRKNRVTAPKQALIFELHLKYKDGKEEIIASDTSWNVTTDTNVLLADLYDGETYDANVDLSKVSYHKAAEFKVPFKVNLLADYSAPIVINNTLKPTYLGNVDGKEIYDFKQNFAGVVHLNIKNAEKEQVITVKHAEILNDDGSINTSLLRKAKATATYICKEGSQSYNPTFSYMGFRYISIEGINKDDIEVEAYVLSSDIREISEFETDHKLLNRLHKNIYWSSLSNFMDIPTDCPQRDERMGWTGDIAVFANTATFNFDLEVFLRKWLKDMRSEQLKTGGFPNTIPAQGYGFPATMPAMAIDFWGDAIALVPLALYNKTGDISYIKDNYEALKKYTNAELFWAHLLSFGNHRYIWHTPSLFHFGDWIAPDVSAMSAWQQRSIYTATCSLKNMATLTSQFAGLLSKREDELKYKIIADKTSKAFCKVLTDGNGKLKQEFQTGYVLPIHYDMFDKNSKGKALRNLNDMVIKNNYCIGTGFPGTPYILFALFDNGYEDTALKMLFNEKCPSWLYEAKVGGTTIWERWDGLTEEGKVKLEDDGTGGMISYNHYASGAVGDFIYTRLAGLQIVEPGYKTFKIKPTLVPQINRLKIKTGTPYGDIKFSYEKSESNIEIKITVPFGTTCELTIGKITKSLTCGDHEFCI